MCCHLPISNHFKLGIIFYTLKISLFLSPLASLFKSVYAFDCTEEVHSFSFQLFATKIRNIADYLGDVLVTK